MKTRFHDEWEFQLDKRKSIAVVPSKTNPFPRPSDPSTEDDSNNHACHRKIRERRLRCLIGQVCLLKAGFVMADHAHQLKKESVRFFYQSDGTHLNERTDQVPRQPLPATIDLHWTVQVDSLTDQLPIRSAFPWVPPSPLRLAHLNS